MANHCYNHITLQGSADVLSKLIIKLETYNQFNYLNGWADYVLGVRDDFNYNFEEDERKDAYYYGSRWFDFDIEQDDPNRITIAGDSAWSPLIKFTEELCKVYQLDGNIYYSETGMDFAGDVSFSKGTEISREECSCKEMNYKQDLSYWFEGMICVLEGADEEEIESSLEECAEYASEEHIEELRNLLNRIELNK